jgi:hypothetical protein
VNFTDQVRAIQLPDSEGQNFTGQTATLAGGGGGNEGKLMKKADLTVLADNRCGKNGQAGKGGLPKAWWKTLICATSPVGTPPSKMDLNNSWRTGCAGDSGAPLFVCPSDSGPQNCTVVAVITGPPPGDTSCAGDSVGQEVSAILPWIRETIRSA